MTQQTHINGVYVGHSYVGGFVIAAATGGEHTDWSHLPSCLQVVDITPAMMWKIATAALVAHAEAAEVQNGVEPEEDEDD